MHKKEHGGGEVVIPLSLLSFVIFIHKPTAAMRKEPAAKTTISLLLPSFLPSLSSRVNLHNINGFSPQHCKICIIS